MTAPAPSTYVLGHTDAEHQRLIRQAQLFAGLTERLFREAGIGAGMRVLDIGCGVGDVSMLAARLTGPSGGVVGVDRDAKALARARERAAASGFENVTFLQADVADLPRGEPFDASVGRFILMFLPDPVGVLKDLRALVRPGGVLAFVEASWQSQFLHSAHLPLRMAATKFVHDAIAAGGGRMNNELAIYRDFRAAGFLSPILRGEQLLGDDSETRRWLHDLLVTILPKAIEFGLPQGALGDLGTLAQRLDDELIAAHSVAPALGVVNAWARRPA